VAGRGDLPVNVCDRDEDHHAGVDGCEFLGDGGVSARVSR